jgi:FkbM family methyltransferase
MDSVLSRHLSAAQGGRTLPWLAAMEQPRSATSLRHQLQEQVPQLDGASLRRLAIVGAAQEGHRLASICQECAIEVAAVADDDPAKVGTKVAGITVAPACVLEALDRTMPIIVASHRVLGSVERLRGLGFTCVWPFALLQVLSPHMFPPHMFYTNWLEDLAENRERYLALASALADDRSLQVLDAALGFRQTLDPIYLRAVVEDGLYAPKGLFQFSDNEIYVDAGSYDGDSVRAFVEHVNDRFERVYAFEPDPQTFLRLCANFANEPRVDAIPSGIYSHKGTLRFRNDSTRGAIFSQDGDTEIAVTTIDDIVGESRVSYIKMNIEGAELNALRGAAHTIARWRPKLAISAYHRAGDLWQVADAVRELNPNYDLYLRQHDGGVIETVLYAQGHH